MSVRFAPSPTGSLHLGNLRTAWVSWKLAGLYSMPWHVRFEDIDTPRVVLGALERQLSDLAALGLKPARLTVQSANLVRHRLLFEKARDEGRAYPCTCSRREIGQALEHSASAPHAGEIGSLAGPVYTGRCRALSPDPASRQRSTDLPTLAWRFKILEDPSGSSDFILGRTSPSGDSKTFTPAYHWACAIDDIDGKHELLVRAIDLKPALEPQRAVWAWLRGAVPGGSGDVPVTGTAGAAQTKFPAVFHTALVAPSPGKRLEKRTVGVTLAELRSLGFSPGDLVERFSKSFRAPLRIPGPGEEVDEVPGEILVSALLGEPSAGG